MYSTLCRSEVLRDCETDTSEREAINEDTDNLRRARFETVWRQHVSELYRRSLHWTGGHRQDADDALSEAALIALGKMPQELPSEDARRWLLRLVFNKCMDIHRHRKRSRHVERDLDAPSPDEEIEAVGPGIESILLADELIAVVHDQIQKLPPRLRGVADLYLLRDLSYSDIAERLALTEVNIRKRMQQARVLLRESLQAYLRGDSDTQAPSMPKGRGSLEIERIEPLRDSGWTLESLEKYVHRHPRGWKKHWELALRLREADSLEKAVLHFREAAGRQPRRIELWSDLGTALLSLNRSEEAREAFETALRQARDEMSRARLREMIARCS